MRRVVLVSALVLVAAAIGVFFLAARPGGPVAPPPAGEEEGGGSQEGAGEGLPAGGPDQPVAAEEGEDGADSAEGVIAGLIDGGQGDTSVEVVGAEQGLRGVVRRVGTGPDGSFRVEGLPPGAYEIRAANREGIRDYRAWALARTGEEVRLYLRPAGPAPGAEGTRIRVVSSGRPVDRGRYTVFVRAGGSMRAKKSWFDGGEILLGSLAPVDEFWVDVSWVADEAGRPVAAGGTLAGPWPAGTREATVELPAERVVTGRILAPDGAGVAGVEVRARPIRGGGPGVIQPSDPHAVAVTDGAGQFDLRGLSTGRYEVVTSPQEAFVPAAPRVLDDATDRLEIVLARAAWAVVTVLGPGNEPVEEAWIIGSEVRPEDDDEEGLYVDGETDARGVARLGPFDPALHLRLEVSGPDGSDLRPVVLDPWFPEDTTVRLVRHLEVRGRVRGTRGEPVPGAEIYVRQPSSEVENWTATDAGGRFSFGGLSEGPVELTLRVGGREVGGPRWVKAGESGIELVADPGAVAVVALEDPPWAGDGGWRWPALTDEASGERRFCRVSPVGGRIYLSGLAPGRSWSFWIGPFGDESYYLVRGLRAGDEISVTRAKGHRLTGKLEWPGEVPYYFVIRVEDRGIRAVGEVGLGGTFEVRGVPEGRFAVTVMALVTGGKLHGSAVVETGTPAVIELR